MTAQDHRPLILDPARADDAAVLDDLRSRGDIVVSDLREPIRAELAGLLDLPEVGEGPEHDRWVHYPWRRRVVALPGPRTMRLVRLDRNRNKLTREEQDRLGTLVVGVVGQSVGHAIAHTLAMEGVCAELRLADFDDLEAANLNRVPASLFDIGLNKAVVTARRIAELDPYLPVTVYPEGITDEVIDGFFDGLSIVVEECDSLDVKLAVREAAQRHRVPLLMETSDRGLLDVERYDLEQDRPPFHGMLDGAGRADLRGLSTRDKAPYVIRILDAQGLSTDFAASLVEIDQTLSSWPQLGGDVQLGGATVAAAVRRIGLGLPLPSGRTRVDIQECLDALAPPIAAQEPDWSGVAAYEPPSVESLPFAEAVAVYAGLAPSGGNVQPWTITSNASDGIRIELDPKATTGMDIGFRGSAVAVGAALYNARVAAAAYGVLGDTEITEAPGALTATLRWGRGADPDLARDLPGVLARHTNRHPGTGTPLAPEVLEALAGAARPAGGTLRAITAPESLESAAVLLAASDRIRYLTPDLHAEMFAELRLPGDDLDSGLDLRTLEPAPDELAKLAIARRPDVMSRLRAFGGGVALGEYSLERVRSSSALLAICFDAPAPTLTDYAQAGAAVQRVWIEAERHGLAVQPMSPVFLYARTPDDLAGTFPGFEPEVTSLQERFSTLLAIPPTEAVALVLRLTHAPPPTTRSARRPHPAAGPR
ncbi:Rv1355c family protein [Thermomonospora umbrina]|uniref:ThiF family protein n=1 Tax=Thermomonospora umbrina TaxID=111806 RepID=A0A3D9SM11_9ACTN|nr:Rv1355c family protein [Thermomonospora umbrina]REE96767.1 ThiF family protein [Thermomonospora umbrina]